MSSWNHRSQMSMRGKHPPAQRIVVVMLPPMPVDLLAMSHRIYGVDRSFHASVVDRPCHGKRRETPVPYPRPWLRFATGTPTRQESAYTATSRVRHHHLLSTPPRPGGTNHLAVHSYRLPEACPPAESPSRHYGLQISVVMITLVFHRIGEVAYEII